MEINHKCKCGSNKYEEIRISKDKTQYIEFFRCECCDQIWLKHCDTKGFITWSPYCLNYPFSDVKVTKWEKIKSYFRIFS